MRLSVGLALCCLCTAVFAADPAHAAMRKNASIPAEGLGAALQTLANTYDFQVLYKTELVQGLKTQGAAGALTSEEALTKVLAGTGLSYKYLDANTVTVYSAASAAATGAIQSQSSSPDTSTKEGSGKNSSQDFRVAQVDQTPSGPQVVGDATSESKQTEGLEEILVTGTHIRGTQPSSPVLTITGEDIASSGYTNIGDLMRTLPQNSASGASPQTLTGSGPNGTAAGNFAFGSAPNLRGLGPASTLTLVNGRRLPQDSSSGAVDISLIPVDAIDRVEVVTDGASATYGSDAVAGVVNFILKRNYDDSQTSASYGNSTEGGGRDWRVSELIGTSWTGGSVVAVYEHETQDTVDASQRSFTSGAPTPFGLLPSTTRNSGYASIHQELLSGLEAYAEGLYTSREAGIFQTFSYGSYYITSPVRQYQASVGLDYSLPNTWKVGVSGNYGQQRSSFTDFLLPSAGPQYAESNRGTTRTVEVDADGHLMELPTGSARLAVGAGNRAETYSDLSPPGPAIASGSRQIDYAFAELDLPLLKPSDRPWLMGLNLNLGGRYEHYSDFGHKAVPKVGLVYVPSKQLKLRASASQSFRAPAISDVYGPYHAYLTDIPNPASTSPDGSPAIITYGGRPTLQPETATSETVGVVVTPSIVPELAISPTYFHINYKNRIGSIANSNAALTDPANAPFVTKDPSPALQEATIAGAAGGFPNYSDGPYDPSTVVALIDGRPFNFGRQTVDGVDLLITYTKVTTFGSINAFLNGTYMDLWQQVTPESPTVPLAGTSFNPPRVRGRAGTTWSLGPWSATATLNYLGHEVNTLLADRPDVSSWTTVDAQIVYTIPKAGPIHDARISLSALNIFDRNPPFLVFDSYRQGFNYDVVNATPMGRYVTVQAVVPVSW